jgi:hypothetical protein
VEDHPDLARVVEVDPVDDGDVASSSRERSRSRGTYSPFLGNLACARRTARAQRRGGEGAVPLDLHPRGLELGSPQDHPVGLGRLLRSSPGPCSGRAFPGRSSRRSGTASGPPSPASTRGRGRLLAG